MADNSPNWKKKINTQSQEAYTQLEWTQREPYQHSL